MEKIVSAARTRGEAAIGEAEAKKAAEIASGMSALDAEFSARLASEKKRISESDGQEISAYRLAEMNRVRVLKRSLLDGVYAAAWEKALAPAAFRSWAEKRMKANCRAGDLIIVAAGQHGLFSGELADLVKRSGVTLSPEKGAFRAGFILERGDLRINCTLDQEMNAAIRDKEIEISGILFRKS